MRRPVFGFASLFVIVAFASATLSADRVKLRSGKVVEGSFMSADVKVVRILLDNGRVAEFSGRRRQRCGVFSAQGSCPTAARPLGGTSADYAFRWALCSMSVSRRRLTSMPPKLA